MTSLVESQQAVEKEAAATLTAAIKASADFASWIGWEYLQNHPSDLATALKIEASVKAGQFTLDDLCNAAQFKSMTAVPGNLDGNPNPVLKVLGYSFDIADLLSGTKVEVWTSGNAKNLQYHAREFFTGVETGPNAGPDGYVKGWENPNHAPVAEVSQGAVDEGDTYYGAVHATDVDAGDTLTYALKGTAPAGLKFNPNGTYEFNAIGDEFQSLAAGGTKEIKVTYVVTDSKGATAESTLTITVTGTNDGPVAINDVNAIKEDADPIIGNVLANDSDLDTNDTHSVQFVND